MSVTLDQARIISEAALAKARELGLKPISVTIMAVSYTHLTLPTILLV